MMWRRIGWLLVGAVVFAAAVDRQIDQAIDRRMDRPIDRLMDRPIDRLMDRPINRLADRSKLRITELEPVVNKRNPIEVFEGSVPESSLRVNPDGSIVEVEPTVDWNLKPGNDDLVPVEVIVNTEYGPVKGGFWKDQSNVLSFIDIPYAKFSRPFEAPTAPENWTAVREHQHHTHRCPQLSPPFDNPVFEGDTDCLTLSVFVRPDTINASVIFHIYDGEFNFGSAHPDIYGPDRLVAKDVILVLPNYRLGALGFLCLQNDTAPGNAALKDLTLALKWTKNNIASFGGNGSRITVSGDGTAGALAEYLALAPESKQYISSVISESGSVLAHWAFDRNPIETANELVENAHAAISDLNTLQVIFNAHGIAFRPCVEKGEDAFLRDTPAQILKDYKSDIKFMVGSANHAGMHATADQDWVEINYDFVKFLPADLRFDSDFERRRLGAEIRSIYFNGSISLDEEDRVSLFHTDASYLGPSLRLARALVGTGHEVYFYEFAYVGELNRERNSLMDRITVNGAARGDIVGYAFSQEESNIIDDDDFIIDFVTTLWASFAANGRPTLAHSTLEWKQFKQTDQQHEQFLSIETDPKVLTGVHQDRLARWSHLYDHNFIERNHAFRITDNELLMLIMTVLLIINSGYLPISQFTSRL